MPSPALSHPNVLTTFDVAIGESAYLVTELLEGETLRALINGGPLPCSRATEIVLQSLAGLATASYWSAFFQDCACGRSRRICVQVGWKNLDGGGSIEPCIDGLYGFWRCSASTARYIASWTSTSAKQLNRSTNGFGPPAPSFAYFACMPYSAG